MATVSKELAEAVIANDGYYLDDPRVARVVEYQSRWTGITLFAILYPGEDLDRYHRSPDCMNACTLWDSPDHKIVTAILPHDG